MKKPITLILSLIALLTGCERKQEGMIYVDGPGTKDDISYLKETWGVDLPEGDSWKVKREDGLMVYMSSHDKLPAYEESIGRDWKKLEENEMFSHQGFKVDGSKDLKIRYAEWNEENTRKMIFVDHSTAIISYMAFPNEV